MILNSLECDLTGTIQEIDMRFRIWGVHPHCAGCNEVCKQAGTSPQSPSVIECNQRPGPAWALYNANDKGGGNNERELNVVSSGTGADLRGPDEFIAEG